MRRKNNSHTNNNSYNDNNNNYCNKIIANNFPNTISGQRLDQSGLAHNVCHR